MPLAGGLGVVIVCSLWLVTHYDRWLEGTKIKTYGLQDLLY
jgi:hypothetical protein